MSDTNEKAQRILGRQLTRELNDEEITLVAGAAGGKEFQDAEIPTGHLADGGGGDTWTGNSWDDATA